MEKSSQSLKKLLKEEVDFLLKTDRDFILSNRFDFSIQKLILRYPEGAPDRIIAQALGITEDEVEELYQTIVNKLKTYIR